MEKVKTPETKEISKDTYTNINTPDGNLPHHFFSTEEMEKLFKGAEILTNKCVDEYSNFMKKTVNHIIFICKNGEK